MNFYQSIENWILVWQVVRITGQGNAVRHLLSHGLRKIVRNDPTYATRVHTTIDIGRLGHRLERLNQQIAKNWRRAV